MGGLLLFEAPSLTSVVGVMGGGVVALMLLWAMWPDPGPIAGIYRQPDKWYWLKRAVLTVMLHLGARQNRKMKKKKKGDWNTRQPRAQQGQRESGKGMSPFDMECCQPLPDHPHALDWVYVGGASSEGGGGPSLALRVGRRHARTAEVWLVLHVPGVGCLEHPAHPDTLMANTDPHSFSAGGLRFEVIRPMKTWRVRFSGPLRVGPCNNLQNRPATFLDVSFSFQWDAFTADFDSDSDVCTSLLSDALAREEWTKDLFNLQKTSQCEMERYQQWGELKGTLNIEGHPTQHLRLKSCRDRAFGVQRWTDFHRYIHCSLYIENGAVLQVRAVSQPGKLSHFRTGCLVYATGERTSLSAITLNLWEVGEEEGGHPPDQWGCSFVAGGVHYSLEVRTRMDALLYLGEDRGGVVHQAFCDVTLNGQKGWGLSEFFHRNSSRSDVKLAEALPLLAEPDWDLVQENTEELCLPFTSPACRSSALVGGKGSQLALLTQMSLWEPVSVPPGLCLTLKAFEKHTQVCEELGQVIKTVAKTGATSPATLASVCQEASGLFSQTAVCGQVRSALRRALTHLFGEDWASRRLAVRSSAAGEDGSDASSAGQLDTFLGVHGEDEMLKAVQKCWASAFAYQAVEYRRQQGQPLATLVGVVIQEMVPAETAGVLFTIDPVTNNASLLSINASYGLGESVVSGHCEPDTITVRREWDDSVTIAQRHSGSKKTKLTMQDKGGVVEEQLSADNSQRYCLSDDAIKSLAKIGIQTEKYFGSPRDIEWAYVKGTFYLLQARPVTTFQQESEEELMHEFDSALAGGYEWLTTGNIGEMMPGAVTPLCLSTFVKAIATSLQRFNKECGSRQQVVDVDKTVTAVGNHLFINLTETFQLVLDAMLTNKDIVEINLLGEVRPDLDLAVARAYSGRPSPGHLKRAWNGVKMIQYINKSGGMMEVWEKRLKDYSIGEKCESASQLYADIDRRLEDFMEVWHWAVINGARSGSSANILMGIIKGSSGECKAEHFGDIALLLSQCQDVYSAEVPNAIQDLAKQIAQEGLQDEFCSATSEECVALLRSDKYPVLREKTQTFLQRHGHRCVREAEMREKSWQLDPSKLMNVLKTILKTGSYESTAKKIKTAKQLIAELQTPTSFLQRKILQYFLPKAWVAVAGREWGKSVSVKMNDIFKMAYWRLAALMVKEGRLPDEDLMFFLTHEEIGVVLHTRSAHLVMKAQRRRKVLSKQMELRFQKVNFGHPVPIDRRNNTDNKGETASVLKGMPVSQGVVRGPARIVLSLADAHTIQAGDVLVVTSTDVGWSPYFPLIAGLVTEIGGLISHGAVVAREYGIPCVVNIPDATLAMRSGVEVELDGRAGTVKVLTLDQ